MIRFILGMLVKIIREKVVRGEGAKARGEERKGRLKK